MFIIYYCLWYIVQKKWELRVGFKNIALEIRMQPKFIQNVYLQKLLIMTFLSLFVANKLYVTCMLLLSSDRKVTGARAFK